MMKVNYVGYGSEEDSIVFAADNLYNNIDDNKNIYLHIQGHMAEKDGNLPLKITPKQLKALAKKLLELAERVEKRK
jgi:hypothetical protein